MTIDFSRFSDEQLEQLHEYSVEMRTLLRESRQLPDQISYMTQSAEYFALFSIAQGAIQEMKRRVLSTL